jgi:hypothetical protein
MMKAWLLLHKQKLAVQPWTLPGIWAALHKYGTTDSRVKETYKQLTPYFADLDRLSQQFQSKK